MVPATQGRQKELHPGGVPQIEWILAPARSFGDGRGGYGGPLAAGGFRLWASAA
jgi:hypothetical protein